MERIETSLAEIERQYNYSGVAVFITDSKGRILVTRERKKKETDFERGTLRKSNQLGIFTETRKDGEDWRATVIRGIREEFGLKHRDRCNLLQVNKDSSYIGETLFREGVLATVIQMYCLDTEKFLKSVKAIKSLDVLGFFQIPIFQLSGNIRYGVKRVLEDCSLGMIKEESLLPLNRKSLTALQINTV